MALALLAAGCATYTPRPLDPRMELARLGQRTLDRFVVERARPGQGAEAPAAAFDLTDGLSEAELVAVALTLNPGLRAQRLEIGRARALLITAGLWPNPGLDVTWQPGIGGTTGSTSDVDLLIELLQPGVRSARRDVATARLDRVAAGIAAREWRLAAEVRLQWMAVLKAEQSVALLGEEVALRERFLALLERRKEVGEGTELDVSVAELGAAEARRDRRRARTELEAARRALNRLLGLPPGTVLPLTDSGRPLRITVFDDLSDAELEQRLLRGRFDLRALESAYAQAEHELRLAVRRQFPRLALGPAFSRELEGGDTLGLGLRLELPLFNRNQGEIAEKTNQRDRARAVYVAHLHRLTAEAHEARGQMRRARLEVEAQEREVLPLVRRNQALFEGALRARALNVLDWVTARQRALRARQTYLESLVRYRNTVIRVEAATGVPLTRPAGEQPPGKEG